MRILFTFAGGTGHFLPLVPLARAAVSAGHDVAFAGQEGMVGVVEAAGFVARPSGGATLLRASERRPLAPVDLEREAQVVRTTYAGRVARERAEAVLALCADRPPDIVVRDEMDFGAAVAAERVGVPHVRVECIASGAFAPTELVEEPLRELLAVHGLPGDPELKMLERELVLSPFPASLRDPASPPPARLQRFRAPRAEAREPAWLAELAGEPLTYLTLGTIFNLESGDLFERALEGLSALPGHVVVTLGREVDRGTLGPQPPNVHVHGWVEQDSILRRCRLVVSHGGSGSVLGALAHGIPLVVLPLGADQPLNAERVEQLGAGRRLDAVAATPEEIRKAAAAVLDNPGYRAAAAGVAREVAALPGPERALALVEQLPRSGGGGL